MAYSIIPKPSLYFNTKLYTGTTNAQSITGVGFQPDMTWIKVRSSSAYHVIQDAVRGATGTDNYSLITNAEASDTDDAITSFDSDGFSLGTDANDRSNYNGQTHVAWNWKANGAGSANTAGTINSTVSANTTSGFSIVKYTGNGVSGATVGHGLTTAAPKIVLIKKISASDNWSMLNTYIPLDKYMNLNSSDGQVSDSLFNNTAPSTSVFTIDSDGQVNGNGNVFIAYCWSEVAGFSKFGKYTGNGSATGGTFVYTGFKPGMIIAKIKSGSSNWRIFDSKRNGYNIDNNPLFPNTNSAEGTDDNIDILSNGFKWRTTDGALNGDGSGYIFMAFAEEPLVANSGTDGVPATAR